MLSSPTKITEFNALEMCEKEGLLKIETVTGKEWKKQEWISIYNANPTEPRKLCD